MDLILKRDRYGADGVFGHLITDNGNTICLTLEHSFGDDQGGFYPKVLPATYKCVRGIHQLSNGVPFETFEVTNVPGHTGILFHSGNKNSDSEGCILLGEGLTDTSVGQMISNSRVTFQFFMQLQSGEDSFNLTVLG